MRILFAGAALSMSMVVLSNRPTPEHSAPATDVLVFEQPSNLWFEGPWVRASISTDEKWTLFFLRLGDVHLISLAKGRADPEMLRGGLDRVTAATFCGAGMIRLGARGKESGLFFPGPQGPALSELPSNAIPICSPDGSKIAFYKAGAQDRSVFIGTLGSYQEYPLDGRVVSMAFSPDGVMFYELVFQANGESTLSSIEVNTGKTRTVASHLDASPGFDRMAIGPDGKSAHLALAGDGPPNDAERQNPRAERWLKIYEMDLATGSRRRVVESPGQDNTGPAVIDGRLYWSRTVVHDSIVAVPAAGGDAKEIVAGGEVPMWSPDGRRIAYFFGGWRLADWALNLDDAVVSVDENMRRLSEPSIIVAGNHEDFPPAWSPDGKWIAFHSHRSAKPVPEYSAPGSADDIWLRRADDINAPEIRLTNFGWEAGSAYWSPDGRKLMFESFERGGKPGVSKIYILTMDTMAGAVVKKEMLPLGPEIESANWSAWSPNGQEIAIEDDRGNGKRALWVARADGSHPQKLAEYEGTSYGGLDWTRDGKAIVYAGLAGDRLQIFSVQRAGGVPVQLTHDSGNLMHPRVSPNGRWIACTRIVQSKQIWRRSLQAAGVNPDNAGGPSPQDSGLH
jgi:Tol biopolymer transport system component